MKKTAPTLYLYPGLTFGPVVIRIKDVDGNPVPLAGWSAFAQIRKELGSPVLLDLTPVISPTDTEGVITLPPKTQDATEVVPDGLFIWDLVIRDTSNQMIVPMAHGVVVSERTVTLVPNTDS